MTRILVQRGGGSSSSSSSNQNRPPTPIPASNSSSSSSVTPQQQVTNISQVNPAMLDDNLMEEKEKIIMDELSEYCGVLESKIKGKESVDPSPRISNSDQNVDSGTILDTDNNLVKGFDKLADSEEESDAVTEGSFRIVPSNSCPPPPPPPPPPVHRANSNAARIGSSRRGAGGPGVLTGPSSPQSLYEGEGYNSADEQSPCYGSSYDDAEREHQFETDLRRAKGLEVRKMLEDGNCLFRAVADQVYGDSEQYDLVRQMCIDYMERERNHFSQFITEGFTSYCKRKRRDKVYGNNMEIQALSEMYNRPIHIYSYSTEPINIFHGSYNTDTPSVRLSYHHGNHYNSLVDPRRPNIGAGLGFSSLQGPNIDKDQVKAAIKAQQDQQIDNALVAEGRFYSDLELTEKEIERMVMEASRAEYIAGPNSKHRESSTSSAEPSSSAASSETRREGAGSFLNGSMEIVLSMGFSYLRVVEAYSIFGDDVDSMVCYLVETGNNTGGSRRKGKATK